MTESDWLTSTDLGVLLDFLKGTGRGSDRKLRLFACACCRRIATHFEDGRSLRLVEVSERFADGAASPEVLESAFEDAADAQEGVHLSGGGAVEQGAAEAVLGLRRELQWGQLFEGIAEVVGEEEAGKAWDKIWGTTGKHWSTQEREHREACEAGEQAESVAQAAVLRDLFGPLPFRTPRFDPRWRTPPVRSLAQAAYEERIAPDPSRPNWLVLDPTRLLVLADALEEGGCSDGELLGHLRGPGEHARGCWALDAVLGLD
jgi:hypothetical protein